MNYGEMSDVDIAVLVGKHVSKDGQSLVGITGKACIHEYAPSVGNFGEMCLGWREFDPCNSWSDAGPIIEKHAISLHYLGEECWGAQAFDRKTRWVNQNSLRAAMICFLMTREVSND